MTMQLFSFGHPCEHQLRRACIGGPSCPLNGYPDNWCCSYIKGKIHFKRDKPCEGGRCRWGFTHPTQAQFDTVTAVIGESRTVAAKIDEAQEKELLSFHIESSHIVDTVQCSLHMMRHPPSSCSYRVGQLLAYGAIKAGDPKVFMQLLKTMKKPVDGYILGAYAFLTQGNPPAPAPPKEEPAKGKKKAAAPKADDIVEDLKNDMVDLMNAALSSGGQLVDRDDQHGLQATFILALRQYPKSNKRRQDMLEAAIAKFGNRPVTTDDAPATAATPAAAAAEKPAAPVAAAAGEEAAAPAATPDPERSATAAAAANATPVATPATPAAEARTAVAATPTPKTPKTPAMAAAATPVAAPAAATTATTASTPAAAAAAPPTVERKPEIPPYSAGISQLLALQDGDSAASRVYQPVASDVPLPALFVIGGQFGLTTATAAAAPLGLASRKPLPGDAAASPYDMLYGGNLGDVGSHGVYMDTHFGDFYDSNFDPSHLLRDDWEN